MNLAIDSSCSERSPALTEQPQLLSKYLKEKKETEQTKNTSIPFPTYENYGKLIWGYQGYKEKPLLSGSEVGKP